MRGVVRRSVRRRDAGLGNKQSPWLFGGKEEEMAGKGGFAGEGKLMDFWRNETIKAGTLAKGWRMGHGEDAASRKARNKVITNAVLENHC